MPCVITTIPDAIHIARLVAERFPFADDRPVAADLLQLAVVLTSLTLL